MTIEIKYITAKVKAITTSDPSGINFISNTSMRLTIGERLNFKTCKEKGPDYYRACSYEDGRSCPDLIYYKDWLTDIEEQPDPNRTRLALVKEIPSGEESPCGRIIFTKEMQAACSQYVEVKPYQGFDQIYNVFINGHAHHFHAAWLDFWEGAEPPEHAPAYTCADCGKQRTPVGLTPKIWRNAEGKRICKACFQEKYVYCSHCKNAYLKGTGKTVNGEIYCPACFDRIYFTCHDCGTLHNKTRQIMVTTLEGEEHYVCNSCYHENYHSCNNCGTNEHNELGHAVPNESGYYCDSCFDRLYIACHTCATITRRDRTNENSNCRNCEPPPPPLIRAYHENPHMIFRGNPTDGIRYGFELETEPVEGLPRYDFETAKALRKIDPIEKIYWLSRDGSLSHGGFEIITQPADYELTRENIKIISKILIDGAQMRSHAGGRCGFHIHVTKAPISSLHLYKIMNMIYANPELLIPISQREDLHYCRLDKESDTIVTEAKYKTSDHSRYTAVNVTKHTVEFRIFRGNIRAERLLKNLETVKSIIDFTRDISLAEVNREGYLKYVRYNQEQYSNLFSFLVEKHIIPELIPATIRGEA
jgi:hypothetical protein